MKRVDDFETRRKHLNHLSDEELYNHFWKLADEICKPMLEMGYKYTTPSIERSILLRMGFSSIEAKAIVENVIRKELMGKGCGNVIWRLSKTKGISIREVGIGLIDGQYLDEMNRLFNEEGAVKS